jgi:hypothetical protein
MRVKLFHNIDFGVVVNTLTGDVIVATPLVVSVTGMSCDCWLSHCQPQGYRDRMDEIKRGISIGTMKVLVNCAAFGGSDFNPDEKPEPLTDEEVRLIQENLAQYQRELIEGHSSEEAPSR